MEEKNLKSASMNKVIMIALGSNFEQEKNVAYAMEELRSVFPDMVFSKLLWTEPIGIVSDRFVNALGKASTSMSQQQVACMLKDIERKCGRCKEDKARNVVKLDLDLMQYGDERLKEEDWNRDYIQRLLDSDFCL